MKIMIISDSHGSNHYMLECIRVFEKDIDVIMHLGDHIDDVADIRKEFPKIETYAVAGNNDYGIESSESIVDIGKHRFFLTHGHKYSPYSGIDRLRYKGLEVGANVVLYGHTHATLAIKDEQEDLLVLNPGSISLPRSSNIKSFAILELDKNDRNLGVEYKFYGIFGDQINEFRI
ncbi:MAG: metallophosphoesterase [bacterium]